MVEAPKSMPMEANTLATLSATAVRARVKRLTAMGQCMMANGAETASLAWASSRTRMAMLMRASGWMASATARGSSDLQTVCSMTASGITIVVMAKVSSFTRTACHDMRAYSAMTSSLAAVSSVLPVAMCMTANGWRMEGVGRAPSAMPTRLSTWAHGRITSARGKECFGMRMAGADMRATSTTTCTTGRAFCTIPTAMCTRGHLRTTNSLALAKCDTRMEGSMMVLGRTTNITGWAR
mmetsp:Transcript_21187/g.35052  ORF Transcript_21187/g.35052 Transcript_21187/m.35052 type:complete len:238 (+) Transcript_21187:2722-3435(+)